ncbi:MAG: hypothetical protein WCC12_05685, partial [Anaerolineales bacterium]
MRLLETASPYAYRSNDVGEEGGDAFPEFEEQVFTLPPVFRGFRTTLRCVGNYRQSARQKLVRWTPLPYSGIPRDSATD